MKVCIFFMLACIALLAGYPVAAQYYYDGGKVKVFANGEATLAWCGGFNTPQFTMGDLNHDNIQDLVVFEAGKGIKTFINTGTPGNPIYTYTPHYELNFPPVFDYLILADYNCDGIPDLFNEGTYGFSAYKGYYNSRNELCFTFYKDLEYSNDVNTSGTVYAFNNPGDIPAIVDVDNDGDLDFIAYEVQGGELRYYKNMRAEDDLPCDSISLRLVDRCWGKVYQGYDRTHQLGFSCDETGLGKQNPAQKKTHQGNTPCLFDYDGDGDYDYLDGSVSFNEMTFLLNNKAQSGGVDSMVVQDTTWQTNGKPIELPVWPAAFNVDIDQDGKKDLLIAPNAANASENYKCIWYYKNNTTPGNPSWTFQSDTFMIDKTIDLGSSSYPVLFDYNKDGKPDLFIGSDGYFQSNGLLRSRISYYMNTSTPGNPSFTLQTKDFLSLDSFGFQGIAPAFGDVDNDGKADLILGHSDGTLTYFKNMAASDAVQPDWQLNQLTLTDGASAAISVGGGHAAPFVYDIDKDGKPDLLIGEMYGYVQYYKNTSTIPGTINLTLVTNKLGNIKADPRQPIGDYSTPFVGKIDSSGKDYILLGSNSGNIYRFDSFQNGNVTTDYAMIDTQYAYIDSMYLQYNHTGTPFAIFANLRSSVTVGDIDGDGQYEMIVGSICGGVYLYEQGTDPESVHNINSNHPLAISVYPNPAKDELNISWDMSLPANVQVTIVNMQGQLLSAAPITSSGNSAKVSVAGLPAGVYICIIQSGETTLHSRFAIMR